MKRAKHTLSHYRMHTMKMGELVPCQCVPVLPGDTMQGSNQIVIRVSPLNTPVMHPVTVRAHTWFMPNRLTWPITENGGWEEFITGGPDGNNAQTIPQQNNSSGKKNLWTYLGVPPTTTARQVNALPVRACNAIFNQRYRDQDLVAKRVPSDASMMNIAWEKDDLTTARPWAQKGAQVTLPVGSSDISIDGTGAANAQNSAVKDGAGDWRSIAGGAVTVDDNVKLRAQDFASIDINAFRAGFALQRYQEARSRYGSRFVEYLRYLGVTPSDARLQEPEYLGGGTGRLNFSEVLQTAGTTDGSGDGVGDLYGHGIAGISTPQWRKFFEEHGYIVTLLSVRPKAIYMNGVDREWLKLTKEDYFQRELANLGQQEVMKGQVYLDQADYRAEWGFQDRYDEYRKHPSFIGQDFRDVLNSWHLGRELDETAVLNEDFVTCNPSDRIFQVATNDTLWFMSNNNLVARRMVPKRANPRIL